MYYLPHETYCRITNHTHVYQYLNLFQIYSGWQRKPKSSSNWRLKYLLLSNGLVILVEMDLDRLAKTQGALLLGLNVCCLSVLCF